MNNPFANKKLRIPFYKNTITLVLTPGKMLLFGIIALVTIIWFFFLGLLLGRGEYPERALPEISKMMPQSNGTDIPMTVLTVEPSSDTEQQAIEKKEETKETLAAKTVPAPTKQVADTKKSLAKQAVGTNKSAPKQTVSPSLKGNVPQKKNKKNVQDSIKKETKPIAKTVPQPTQVFDYVYQIASFKDEKSANIFASNVKKSGLKARVASSKSGSTTWSRVVIDFRGTPNETIQLREQLRPFNVDKMVMLKKKAVKK